MVKVCVTLRGVGRNVTEWILDFVSLHALERGFLTNIATRILNTYGCFNFLSEICSFPLVTKKGEIFNAGSFDMCQ